MKRIKTTRARKKTLHGKTSPLLSILKTPKTLIVLVLLCYFFVGGLAGLVLVDLIEDRGHESPNDSREAQVIMRINRVAVKDVEPKAPFPAPDGHKVLVVSVTIRNYSEAAFDFAPVLQTYLTDSNQAHYTMSPSVLTDPISAGKLMPLTETSGELSYLVPNDANRIQFHFVPEVDHAEALSQLLLDKL